ncbi:MAG: hypothetical protein V7651_09420 [Hyphomonas oceanitis]|uniref:hypothetical protein n=1 Tax=Hyphomonas oceanitis TaxID=81033 RepID=UPI003002A667
MFDKKPTIQQIAAALSSVLDAYSSAGKTAPSLVKLTKALQSTSEHSLDDFISLLVTENTKPKKSASQTKSTSVIADRIEHFSKLFDLTINDPSMLNNTIESMRSEAKSRRSGTLTKTALEALYATLVGSTVRFATIDMASDSIRQRLIERINDSQSLKHSQRHKAF